MKIKIYEDRDVFQDTELKGIIGENKVETLKFEYPEEYKGLDMTIEMQDGDWLVADDIQNDEYVLKTNVTSHKNISAQIVFKDDIDNVVFKSEIFEMNFKDALNAVEPLDDTDAKAEEILIGKKAYVQSEKITGTMANNGELNYTPSTEAQTIPEGYTTGGTIAGVTSAIDENIIPTNIRAGKTILGVEGNLIPDKPDQNKTVTPTTQTQTITADTGYELAQVTVEGVTSTIDNNIQAENIKNGINILGVQGNVIELKGETKTIIPTTAQQIIIPTSGKNAITEITVNAVTNAIDSNITSGNIKKNVEILGVTGSYEPNLQSKEVTITENGDTIVTPDTGYDGLNQVNITTNVGGTTEFNSYQDINNYIKSTLTTVQNGLIDKVNHYPVYTSEPVTLYSPYPASTKYYFIHKNSSGKYRIVWGNYPYVSITNNTTAEFRGIKPELKVVTPTTNYLDWFFKMTNEPSLQFIGYYSNTFDTIADLISAVTSASGNISYTQTYSKSFSIVLESGNYWIPYTNVALFNFMNYSYPPYDAPIIGSQRISQNETIELKQ